MRNIENLEQLEQDILKHIAVIGLSTNSGMSVSNLNDVFPKFHPETIRDSVNNLIDLGYLSSPEHSNPKAQAIFFTDDGYHIFRNTFEKKIELTRKNEDLVCKIVARFRQHPVFAPIIVIVMALLVILNILKILSII